MFSVVATEAPQDCTLTIAELGEAKKIAAVVDTMMFKIGPRTTVSKFKVVKVKRRCMPKADGEKREAGGLGRCVCLSRCICSIAIDQSSRLAPMSILYG